MYAYDFRSFVYGFIDRHGAYDLQQVREAWERYIRSQREEIPEWMKEHAE